MAVPITSRLQDGPPTLSFEFFPPKTAKAERALWHAVGELAELRPDFVSVTYGAGGSTRDRTLGVVRRLYEDTDLRPVMHLTCVGSTADELAALAAQVADVGITDVLALRGDPPDGPGGSWEATPGGLRYAADLVALLAGIGGFEIGVAAFPEGHPESPSRDEDLWRLADKCAVGADYAITQFFFDVKQYTTLVEGLRAHGCATPVIPGVLPVTNPAQTRRFAAKVGATIPPDLDARFAAVEHDREATVDLGVAQAAELTLDLLAAGAPGVHFYTMNRVVATRRVCDELRRAGALDPL